MDAVLIIGSLILIALVVIFCWSALTTILTDIIELSAIIAGGILAIVLTLYMQH